jgi:tRNA nucleotidyltransferase (CCA-adding enzyme)
MRNAVKMGFLERLSGGRVFSELILLLQEENPIPAIKRMRDFDLLRFLHPHLKFNEEVEALFERIHHVIAWFDLLFLEERFKRWLIYFYGLIDFLKEGEVEEICQRLSMNNKDQKKVVEGKRLSEQILLQVFHWVNASIQPRRSEIYALLDPLPTEVKLFMMAKTSQMATRRLISLYFTQLKDTKTLLRGADMVQMGIKPGPSIKKRLADLLKARLDEQVMTRQDEMEFISKSQGAK